MKKHLIAIGMMLMLLVVGLSGCTEQQIETGEGSNSSFFNISGNITNYYTATPKIEVDFAISTEDNECNYSAVNENTTILFHSMTISSFNYSIKAGYPKYLLNVSWSFISGDLGYSSYVRFSNPLDENITLDIEIRKDKKIDISFLSPNTLIIDNQPPQVSIAYDKKEGLYPLTVYFSANATDVDGYIDSYFWSFSDGSTNESKTTKHTFGEYGKYSVKLRIADNFGKTAQDTITIKAKIPIVTKQDNDLLLWVGESNDVLSSYISSITFSAANLMASSLDFWGDKCWDDAYDYSNEIDQFTDLSQPFSEMKEKYRLILEDYKSIGVGAGILADYIYSYDTNLIEVRIEGLTNDLETLTNRINELTILVSLVEGSLSSL